MSRDSADYTQTVKDIHLAGKPPIEFARWLSFIREMKSIPLEKCLEAVQGQEDNKV